MKRLTFLSLVFFLSVSSLSGQIQQSLSYQGMLTDANGNPLSGNFDLTFKLYTSAAGGTSIWEESQNVGASDGVFNVILGGNNTLNLPFDQTYWLGVTVGNNSELQPRIQLTATAYSMNTRSIVDGQVVKSINNLKDDVTLTAGDNITITGSGSNLTITANTDANGELSLPYDGTIHSDSSAAFAIRNTGNGVGIVVSGREGVLVESASVNGVLVNSAGLNGVAVEQAASSGMLVVNAGEFGLLVVDAGLTGLQVLRAGNDGVVVEEAGSPSTTAAGGSRNNGFEVQGAQHDGLYVGRADQIGVNIASTGSNGIQVGQTGFDGLQVQAAGRDGIRVSGATDYGINATGTKGAAYLDGDVTVTGAMKGNNGPNGGAPFPRPAYDSGWVGIIASQTISLQHNIGGNIDDYFVDLTTRLGNFTSMAFSDDPQGIFWSMFTNTSIEVHRFFNEPRDQMRVRIWVIQ